MSARPVVVLDMDETLLHTPDAELSKARLRSIPRPGLRKFMRAVSQIGEVHVLSAGSSDYIPLALDSVGLLSGVRSWHSSRRRNPMKQIINGRRWVLVDDRGASSPLTIAKLRQCGGAGLRAANHLVVVQPFSGDRRDKVLHNLPGLIALALEVQRGARS